ncbi:nuclear receptor corepressor 1 [Pelomyxa schiedti]|nr:nuclear receptor corepressor 1 [Pelomyxa schiedti]
MRSYQNLEGAQSTLLSEEDTSMQEQTDSITGRLSALVGMSNGVSLLGTGCGVNVGRGIIPAVLSPGMILGGVLNPGTVGTVFSGNSVIGNGVLGGNVIGASPIGVLGATGVGYSPVPQLIDISSVSPEVLLQHEQSPVTPSCSNEEKDSGYLVSSEQPFLLPGYNLEPNSGAITCPSEEMGTNPEDITDIPCSPMSPSINTVLSSPLLETANHAPAPADLTPPSPNAQLPIVEGTCSTTPERTAISESITLEKLETLLQGSSDQIASAMTKDEILQALDILDTEITSVEAQLQVLGKKSTAEALNLRSDPLSAISAVKEPCAHKDHKEKCTLSRENTTITTSRQSCDSKWKEFDDTNISSAYLTNLVSNLISRNRLKIQDQKDKLFYTSTSSSLRSFDVPEGPSFLTVKDFLRTVHCKQDASKLKLTAKYNSLQEKWLFEVNKRLELLRQSPSLRSHGCLNVSSNISATAGQVPSVAPNTASVQSQVLPALPPTTVASGGPRDPQQVEQDAIARFQRLQAPIPELLSLSFWPLRCPAFVDNNRLMENPLDEEKERKSKDNWTDEEKSRFVTKFIQHPKGFPEIAKALHRTTGEVVAFYYLHRQELKLQTIVRKSNTKKRSRNKETQDSYVPQANVRDNSAAIYTTMAEVDTEWTQHEQKQFIDGLRQYGKDWSSISCLLSCTKSSRHCQAYYTANRRKLSLDSYLPRDPKKVPPRRDRTGTPDWTAEEVTQFLERFPTIGTDWRAMAQCFTSRTPSQLKTFYLENKEKLGLQEPDSSPQARKRPPRAHSNCSTNADNNEQDDHPPAQKANRRCKRRKKQTTPQSTQTRANSPLPPGVMSPASDDEDTPNQQAASSQKPFSADVSIVQDVLDEIKGEFESEKEPGPAATNFDQPSPQPPSPDKPVGTSAVPPSTTTAAPAVPQSPPTPSSTPSLPGTPTQPDPPAASPSSELPPLDRHSHSPTSQPTESSKSPLKAPSKSQHQKSKAPKQYCKSQNEEPSQNHPSPTTVFQQPSHKKLKFNPPKIDRQEPENAVSAPSSEKLSGSGCGSPAQDSIFNETGDNQYPNSPSPPLLSPANSPVHTPPCPILFSPPSPVPLPTQIPPSNVPLPPLSGVAEHILNVIQPLPGIASVYEAVNDYTNSHNTAEYSDIITCSSPPPSHRSAFRHFSQQQPLQPQYQPYSQALPAHHHYQHKHKQKKQKKQKIKKRPKRQMIPVLQDFSQIEQSLYQPLTSSMFPISPQEPLAPTSTLLQATSNTQTLGIPTQGLSVCTTVPTTPTPPPTVATTSPSTPPLTPHPALLHTLPSPTQNQPTYTHLPSPLMPAPPPRHSPHHLPHCTPMVAVPYPILIVKSANTVKPFYPPLQTCAPPAPPPTPSPSPVFTHLGAAPPRSPSPLVKLYMHNPPPPPPIQQPQPQPQPQQQQQQQKPPPTSLSDSRPHPQLDTSCGELEALLQTAPVTPASTTIQIPATPDITTVTLPFQPSAPPLQQDITNPHH